MRKLIITICVLFIAFNVYAVTDNNPLVVNQDTDRVGIGTATPSSDLEIYSASDPTLTFGDAGDDGIIHWETTGDYFSLEGADLGWIVIDPSDTDNWVGVLYSNANNYGLVQAWDTARSASEDLMIGNHTVNQLFLDDGGHVGIGTKVPDTILHIKEDSETVVIRTERNQAAITSSDLLARWEVETQDTTDPGICATIAALSYGSSSETGWRFQVGTPSALTEAMQIDNNGQVGIGTPWPDSPGANLEVKYITGADLQLSRADTTLTADDIVGKVAFSTNDTDNSGIGAYISGVGEGTTGEIGLSIATGNRATITERIRIDEIGTFEFVGDATVWNDVNIGAGTLSGPPGLQPGVVNFIDEAAGDTGIATFALAVGEGLSGALEIPHSYKEGSDIFFHVHWQGIAAPSGTDNVKWELTYTTGKFNETLDAVTTISVETSIDTQYDFKQSDFAAIDGTGLGLDNQFIFTIERVAAVGDAYAGEALLATIGVHFEEDTIGSRGIATK